MQVSFDGKEDAITWDQNNGYVDFISVHNLGCVMSVLTVDPIVKMNGGLLVRSHVLPSKDWILARLNSENIVFSDNQIIINNYIIQS